MPLIASGLITPLEWWVLLDSPVSGSTLGVSGIELRNTNTTNVATNGSLASCESTGSNPGNACDGSTSTLFTSTAATCWWKYTFATGQTIDSVKIIARADGSYTQAPTRVTILVTDPTHNKVVWVAGKTGLGWSSGANNVITVANALGNTPNFRVYSKQFVDQNPV